jgi:hypothetical protein
MKGKRDMDREGEMCKRGREREMKKR